MGTQIKAFVSSQSPAVKYSQVPFSGRLHTHEYVEGQSLSDIIHICEPNLKWHSSLLITINEVVIPREYWSRIRPKPNARIIISRMASGGGGGGLRIVAMIAVAVAATFISGGFGTPLLFGMTQAQATLAGIAVYATGMIAINALIPPAQPEFENAQSQSQTLSVAASRNQYRPFGVMSLVLGRHRYAFPFAAKAYTELLGDVQYVRMLFHISWKKCNVLSLQIGNTDIAAFEEVETQIVCGGTTDNATGLTLFPGTVFEDTTNVELVDTNFVERTSALNTDELTYELNMPLGLGVRDTKHNSWFAYSVSIETRYRETGTSDPWTYLPIFQVTGFSSDAIRRGYRIPNLGGKQIDFQIRRAQAKSNPPAIYTRHEWYDTIILRVVRSIRHELPVDDENAGLMSIRIKATEQLQGVPDTVTGIVTSILPNWNGSAWVDAPTNNPAAIARYILLGPANRRAMATNRIDDQAFVDWYIFCAQKRFTFNKVIDSRTTIHDLLLQVGAAGRGYILPVATGKWTVIIDQPTAVHTQLFTPRNARNFQTSKAFLKPLHGLRVRFINENENWLNDERIVYNDGYNESNATIFESLEFPGVTNEDLIHIHGRFYLSVRKLQPYQTSFETDIEQLVSTKGDKIAVMNDSLLIGELAARAKSITDNGDSTTTVILDSYHSQVQGTTYRFQFRDYTGNLKIYDYVAPDTSERNTFIFNEQFISQLYETNEALVVIGTPGSYIQSFVIKSIRPIRDMAARITCVPYGNIYDNDDQPIPDFQSRVRQPKGKTIPIIESLRSDESVMERTDSGTLIGVIRGAFAMVGNREDVRNVRVTYKPFSGSGSDITTWQRLPLMDGDARVFDIRNVEQRRRYLVRARFVFEDGVWGKWSSTSDHKVIGQTSLPETPSFLDVTELGDGTRIYNMGYESEEEEPIDLKGYALRYLPYESAIEPPWESMSFIKRTGVITEVPYESIYPEEGTHWFAVKAIDQGGRRSEDPHYNVSTLGPQRVGTSILTYFSRRSNWDGTIVEGRTKNFNEKTVLAPLDTTAWLGDIQVPPPVTSQLYYFGLRVFPTIPWPSIITNAAIFCKVEETYTGENPVFSIHGILEPNPEDFVNGTPPSARPFTESSVQWTLPLTDYTAGDPIVTPDVTEIVREIFDQEWYVENNPMAFAFRYQQGQLKITTYEEDPTGAPYLSYDSIPDPVLPLGWSYITDDNDELLTDDNDELLVVKITGEQ